MFLPTSTSSGRISIHALREEGDTWATSPSMVLTNFYPRPPRGGRRVFDDIQRSHDLFLSTPSARRATLCRVRHQATPLHFYPRPPRGGRPCVLTIGAVARPFLSTPSARRATCRSCWRHRTDQRFLSTPSARRATHSARKGKRYRAISIHALREEGDIRATTLSA